MIVLIGGEKGGTGKSTVATNLAAWLAHQGADVMLLDSDRQSTSGNWAALRAGNPALPKVHCVQRNGNLVAVIRDLAARYDHVIVDAGGRDSEELRSALVSAHKVFTPMRPSQSDLWTAEHVNELVKLAASLNPALESYVLITQATTNPKVSEAVDASSFLASLGHLKLANSVVRDRKAYRDAFCEGKSVLELGDAKAIAEIQALAQEVYGGEVQVRSVAHVA